MKWTKNWTGSRPTVCNICGCAHIGDFTFECLTQCRWEIVLITTSTAFVIDPPKVQKLDGMHKKHLLPGFDDRVQEERDIERLTDEITQVL